MEASEVLARFAALAGISDGEAKRFLPLARLCIHRLAARLKPEVDWDEHEDALATAAAGLLLCQYAAVAQTARGGDFKLGDLSVSSPAGGVSTEGARALCDELLAGISPLLAVRGGAFLIQAV